MKFLSKEGNIWVNNGIFNSSPGNDVDATWWMFDSARHCVAVPFLYILQLFLQKEAALAFDTVRRILLRCCLVTVSVRLLMSKIFQALGCKNGVFHCIRTSHWSRNALEALLKIQMRAECSCELRIFVLLALNSFGILAFILWKFPESPQNMWLRHSFQTR